MFPSTGRYGVQQGRSLQLTAPGAALRIVALQPLQRAGNALMAFNNRPATDTIPLLSPFIAPSARALAPLLSQLATPGPLRATAELAGDALRGLSPALVRQVLPLIDQLTPILVDVAQVTRSFA